MCLNLQKSLQILLMESLIHIILTMIGGMRNNVCNCRNHRKADGSRVYWWISKTEVFFWSPPKNLILTAWRNTSNSPRFVAAGVQSLARVPCLSVPRRPRRPCLGLLTMWSTFSGKRNPAGLIPPFFQPSPSDRWHTMQQNSKSLKTKKLVSFIWFQWRQTAGMFGSQSRVAPF